MDRQETVVLIHGLWMTGIEFLVLRRRLERQHGFKTRRFSYQSVRKHMAYNAARLGEYLASLDQQGVHLIGHSLGGLVILRTLDEFPEQQTGRIVLLGAPVRGSEAARGVSRLPMGGFFLGRSEADGLLAGYAPQRYPNREIGVIAGNLPIGLGRLVSSVPMPHDGTVAVDETRFDGITDHVELPVSHSNMIFSRKVADEVAAFLINGRFSQQGEVR